MDESKDSSRQSTLSGSTEPVSLTRSALREAIKFSPLNCIPPATQAKDLKTAGAADNGSGLEKKRASVVAQVHFLPTPVPDIVASHINYPGWKLAKSISPTSWRKLRRQEQLARTMIEMILTQQRLKLASLQTQVLQQQVMILAAELQIIESRQAMIDVEAGLHLKSAIASLSRRVQQTSEYVLKTLKIPTTTEGQLLQLRVPQISALVGAPFFQVKSVTHRTPRPPLTAFNLSFREEYARWTLGQENVQPDITSDSKGCTTKRKDTNSDPKAAKKQRIEVSDQGQERKRGARGVSQEIAGRKQPRY